MGVSFSILSTSSVKKNHPLIIEDRHAIVQDLDERHWLAMLPGHVAAKNDLWEKLQYVYRNSGNSRTHSNMLAAQPRFVESDSE